MRIGTRVVGSGHPCLIVAEVGQAHEGSLSLAHAYVDAVAHADACAVKFQCHLGEPEGQQWRVEPRWKQDTNRDAYWQRMGFTAAQWAGLAQHAAEVGLIFLCSPFSVEAVKLLDPLVPAWKVPSGEVFNERLREAIHHARTSKPAILSTGLLGLVEIDVAEAQWRETCREVALLQCVTAYPCAASAVGLNVLAKLEREYQCPVGLSDHTGTIWASLAAVALGASIVEVHVKLSVYDQGFDASSSITIEELTKLVGGVRFIEAALTPVDKDQIARELEPMRELFVRKHA